jgi:uncharacterized protein (DUF1810 family)
VAGEVSDLARFKVAQDGVWDRALAKIKVGCKTSYWMWFIFPKLRGLGRSEQAMHFGITDVTEVRAYLADPLLGRRLVEIAKALLALETRDVTAIMGVVFSRKLQSSMTLFAAQPGAYSAFAEVLIQFLREAAARQHWARCRDTQPRVTRGGWSIC